MNMIVVVGIAVLAVAALGAFLLSGSLSNISTADAQRIFSSGCTWYCSSDLYGTLKNAYDASKNDKDFVSACLRLGFLSSSEQNMEQCFKNCGNCNLDIGRTDTVSGIDNMVAKTTRG
jgi:hypothetical protein